MIDLKQLKKKVEQARGFSGLSADISWSSLAALIEQLECAQKDAARIDHLQNRGATVDLIIGESTDTWKFRTAVWVESIHSDLRSSIDAAMAATKGEEA